MLRVRRLTNTLDSMANPSLSSLYSSSGPECIVIRVIHIGCFVSMSFVRASLTNDNSRRLHRHHSVAFHWWSKSTPLGTVSPHFAGAPKKKLKNKNKRNSRLETDVEGERCATLPFRGIAHRLTASNWGLALRPPRPGPKQQHQTGQERKTKQKKPNPETKKNTTR